MERSLLPELMDDPSLSGPRLDAFHRDLRFIHKILGTFPTLLRALQLDPQPVRRVLDIGCGGGDLLDYLRQRLDIEVTGIDLKPGHTTDVPILAADATQDPLPEADVAICTLLAHHLTPEQNIAMIRNVGRSCRRFLIHDLIRHPAPLAMFSIFLYPLVGYEAAVDGQQSIRRAFTPPEFKELVREALKGTKATATMDVSRFLSRQIIDISY